MSYQLPHWVWPVALVVVCVLAVWRGRDEERLATGGVVLCWALSLVVYRSESQDTQWAILAIDTALLGLYAWISLRTVRFWPLFAAAFQLLVLVPHLAHAIDPSIGGWAYWTAARLFSYSALFAIGYGAWTAPRVRRTLSADGAVAGQR